MSSNKKRLVPCPECGGLSEFSPENPFRPFCSERCKLIDLGVWASEGYKIPTPITAEDLESEDLIQNLSHDD
jgi:endogenous inhibitor of DNA gyrase (YacG/DUF329 family)